MARLFLICGLPGSGKTTLAKAIEREHGALRLTEDEWMDRLFDTGYDDDKREKVKAVQWTVAARVLQLGIDAILDWGFWTKAERDEFRGRARDLRADVVLRYLDTPIDELLGRLRRRNEALPPATFHIDEADLRSWASLFEPPTADELLE